MGIETREFVPDQQLIALCLCAICHDEVAAVPVVPNGCHNHIFCTDCLTQWLERSKTCPTCRSPSTDTNPLPPHASVLYGMLRQRCYFEAEGCDGVFPPTRFNEHLRHCQYRPVCCDNRKCRWHGVLGELPAHMTTCVDRQRVWTDSDLACYVCIWRVEHETEEELTATPLHCPYQSHIKDGR